MLDSPFKVVTFYEEIHWTMDAGLMQQIPPAAIEDAVMDVGGHQLASNYFGQQLQQQLSSGYSAEQQHDQLLEGQQLDRGQPGSR